MNSASLTARPRPEKGEVGNARRGIRAMFCAVLIILLTLAALGRVVGHPFVTLDDKEYVTENPPVLRGLTVEGLRWALTTFHSANWHPLTWASHMMDIQVFGLSPAGHHATNLLMHLVASVMLFLVLTGMTGAPGRGFFVAALFAIHPLHVESVAWVAERKDVLSALLFTLALAAWLRYVRRPSFGRYVAVTGVFALGLMAKAMLVTFPFLLGLLDAWPLGRFPGRCAPRAARRPGCPSLRELILEKVPLVALSIGAAVLAYASQAEAGSLLSFDALALPWRTANAAGSVMWYLANAFWPTDLAVLYSHQGGTLPVFRGAIAVMAVLAVTFAAVAVARRLPWLSVGWLWFLGMLVPVIGIIQVGSQGMADRYTYLPLVGVFLSAVWEAELVVRRRGRLQAMLWFGGALVLVALSSATFLQAGFWRDSRTLLSRAVRVNPESWTALANLALVADAEGKSGEAIELYRRAAEAAPTSAIVRFNLATVLSRSGRTAEAETEYRAAIALDPALAAPRNNLANLLYRSGRFGEALEQIQAAVAAAPDDLEIRANLERIRSAARRP